MTMDTPFEPTPAMFLRVSHLTKNGTGCIASIDRLIVRSQLVFASFPISTQKTFELVNTCDPNVATWYV